MARDSRQPEFDISGAFADPYEVNFVLHIPDNLETDRVKLVPFVPAAHAAAFYEAAEPDIQDLARYLPIPLSPYDTFVSFLEVLVRQDPTNLLFVILDKMGDSGDGSPPIAGIIGLLHTSTLNLSTEIGPVVILPKYQRSHVSTHAIGILTRFCLNVPSEGGIGYRRVAWTANPLNFASLRAAERMGFRQEGTIRWSWVLPAGKDGKPVDKPGRGEGKGRDSALFALCWDDWENGGREHVDKLIDRK
ncbi:acyl-CoA N-acyltransferase [Pluteus cervinus]|uniref:Acyl-CoA N-acyltransferase n=1 Tax=Pluteus cervinus TaxID=181527 RepID=A0ACD3BBL8_9AGAR|nr:acyl-CoA N-acyltransferase [Pluteus cervinus]